MKESPIEDAKTYMSTRQIPQLFESLMTGLMFNRPENHLDFLIECLNKAKASDSPNEIHWNAFVDFKRSGTLPPISPTPGKHQAQVTDDIGEGTSPVSRDATKDTIKKGSPLPPIGKSRESTSTSLITIASNVPIVLIMGGPGSGRLTQCQKLLDHYKQYNWVHLSIGDLLRQQMLKSDDAEKKWSVIKELVKNGEMAPQDVTQSLVQEVISAHPNAEGFLIEGYPRTMEQLDEFNRTICRVDLVILLDCDEEMCRQRLLTRGQNTNRIDDNEAAVQRRIDFFKKNTLPVVHHFETEGKLVPLPGDRDTEEIFFDLTNIIDVAFYGRKPASVVARPPSKPKTPSTPRSARKSKRPSLPRISTVIMSEKDEGRKAGLPTVPIIFIMGGPGCGKGAQCEKLVGRFPNFVHLSMGDLLRNEISDNGTADEKISMLCQLIYSGEMAPNEMTMELLLSNIKKNTKAQGFIVEGFPRDKKQLEEFNQNIGGLTSAVLLDCEEEQLFKNVRARRETSAREDDREAALNRRIEFYKTNTLPVIKYLDDQKKLSVVGASNRTIENIHYDLASIMNGILYQHGQNPANTKHSNDESEQEVVEEEVIVAEAAATTGESAEDSLSRQSTKLSKQSTTISADMAELKNKKVIFVVGGPGCGKGTQCAKIVEKYGFCHLSSGDLLRDEVQSGSDRGKELNSIMQSGALVSLDIVLTLLKEAMQKNTEAKGFLIDGYPRELEQGTRFESELVAPACVLYFEVPDDVMVERLLERAKTSGRVDDNEETIKKRLKTFHDHSDKVLEHYQSKNLLCKIDARGSVDDIFGEVVKRIDSTN